MLDSVEFKTKISKFLKIPVEKVKDDAVLTELVTDSFALIDMVVELQEEYSSRLTQENLKDVRTVADLKSQLEQHVFK